MVGLANRGNLTYSSNHQGRTLGRWSVKGKKRVSYESASTCEPAFVNCWRHGALEAQECSYNSLQRLLPLLFQWLLVLFLGFGGFWWHQRAALGGDWGGRITREMMIRMGQWESRWQV